MYYVYHLVDPRNDEVFCVGKGTGGRLLDHEAEAKAGRQHPKCDVIRAIWAAGMKVKRKKVRHFQDEQEAFNFERAEVERIGLHNLTNKIPGGGRARDQAGPVETVQVAKTLIKWLANAVLLKARGYKLSGEWQRVVDEMLPHSLNRLRNKYGDAFVSGELAKHKIEMTVRAA